MDPVVYFPPPQAVVSKANVKDPARVSPKAAAVLTECTVYKVVD